MGKYAESAAWADIEPLPQNDGPGQPLAAILYPEAYSEAMSYLRAVIAKQETSERVLELTEDIISMNAAHYTVWYVHSTGALAYFNSRMKTTANECIDRLYRAKTIFATHHDLRTEIQWLNPIALRHLKNYQIWHHRQTMIDRLNDPTGETAFLEQMFEQDSKNYHVWSYRQWLVKRFGLWDGHGELKSVEQLLEKDVRNNSAWNHRWFLNFGREDGALEEKERVDREVEYVLRLDEACLHERRILTT
jgi:protein farnesyltransferase/geranylgeranyltransferase type-1 subunit alpha